MIIGRYILKEIIVTLLLIVSILLLIQMSNQFIVYLNSAASGGITLTAIFKMMLLQLPLYLSYLLPLALFLAVLLVFGQFYVNQEISVLFSCGYSQFQLSKLVMLIAIPAAVITGLINFELQPLIQRYQLEMKNQAYNAFSVDKLFAKRFQDIPQMGWVLYADKNLDDGLGNVFLVRHYPENKDYPNGFWELVRADRLHQRAENPLSNEFVHLEKGISYRGQPGEKNFRVVHFDQSAIELSTPPSKVLNERNKVEVLSLQKLWRIYGENRANQIEFNWRLSIPVCALILALWVVPLSHLNPRQGRYAKVFYASLICLFYLNAMFISRGLAFSNTLSPIVAIWWIHIFMLLILIGYLGHRRGGLSKYFNCIHFKNSSC